MLLVLVNTPGGKEILTRLKEEKIKTVVMLPSVYDAAVYGIDNAVVGSMKEQRIRKIISENEISAVIDALDESQNEVSFEMSGLCNKMGMPLLKYMPFEYDYSMYDNVKIFDKFCDAAETLSSDELKVFVFGEAKNIRKIADNILERQNLYRLVLKGSEMDLDFSADSGVPLANLLAVESLENVEEILRLMKIYGISKFVCCENPNVIDTVELAKKAGIEIFIVKDEKPEYSVQTSSVDRIIDCIKYVICGSKKDSDTEDKNFSSNTPVSASASASASDSTSGVDMNNSVSENDGIDAETMSDGDASNTLTAAMAEGCAEYSVPKSKVVNKDGTINMKNFVKYVKQQLNSEK